MTSPEMLEEETDAEEKRGRDPAPELNTLTAFN